MCSRIYPSHNCGDRNYQASTKFRKLKAAQMTDSRKPATVALNAFTLNRLLADRAFDLSCHEKNISLYQYCKLN